MKHLYSLIVLILLSSCSSYKTDGVKIKNKFNKSMKTNKDEVIIQEDIEVLPNSKIVYKKDTTGAGFVEITEGDKTVIKYVYNISPKDKTLMDGNYTQEVLFEFSGNIKETELKDKSLSDLNVLVGMHGFFRRAGVYPIKKGMIKVHLASKNKAEINIQIDEPIYMVKKREISFAIDVK